MNRARARVAGASVRIPAGHPAAAGVRLPARRRRRVDSEPDGHGGLLSELSSPPCAAGVSTPAPLCHRSVESTGVCHSMLARQTLSWRTDDLPARPSRYPPRTTSQATPQSDPAMVNCLAARPPRKQHGGLLPHHRLSHPPGFGPPSAYRRRGLGQSPSGGLAPGSRSRRQLLVWRHRRLGCTAGERPARRPSSPSAPRGRA